MNNNSGKKTGILIILALVAGIFASSCDTECDPLVTCTPPEFACEGVCVSVLTDSENCGACGNVCSDEKICFAGECRCPDGLISCDDGCVDMMTDERNCGECGVVCPAAQTCLSGECACPDGEDFCDGKCVDLLTDPDFCGDCETSCDDSRMCIGGECRTKCEDIEEDEYENNDSCGTASSLPSASQDPTIVELTLHHQDGSPDIDWFGIHAPEPFMSCIPGTAQCSFFFNISFTPPEDEEHDNYRMCVYTGECGDFATEHCSTDWNDAEGRYEFVHIREGTCGIDDSQTFIVRVDRIGEIESCAPYYLEYTLEYRDVECM